ncbi:hypothetical protein BH23PLA1_BH23PLA1_24980 [soil metagenome]
MSLEAGLLFRVAAGKHRSGPSDRREARWPLARCKSLLKGYHEEPFPPLRGRVFVNLN